MKVEITILSAPISVFPVSQVSPLLVELAGIGTLTVNNYYSEGGEGGYILTESDKAEIAALAAYDDTEIRELITQIQAYDDTQLKQELNQTLQQFGSSVGQQLSEFSQTVSTTDQKASINASEIESIKITLQGLSEMQETINEHSQSISTITGALGDIATILDAINGEVV